MTRLLIILGIVLTVLITVLVILYLDRKSKPHGKKTNNEYEHYPTDKES